MAYFTKGPHVEERYPEFGGMKVTVVDGNTGMPLVCWRCGEPAFAYRNILASAAASAGSLFKPVCPEH